MPGQYSLSVAIPIVISMDYLYDTLFHNNMENFQIEDELYRIPTELKPFRKVNTLHWMFFVRKIIGVFLWMLPPESKY